jgi:hypothetical protein
MNKELTRIPFNEFAANLSRVFDRVVKDKETVMVEKEGRGLAILKPISSGTRRRRKSSAAYKAFLAAAGSWKDVDTDKLIADIYASRSSSSRPAIEL